KYFPPNKNAKLRNEITTFQQMDDESLYEAWERYKELLRKCPHHGIPTNENAFNLRHSIMVSTLTQGS
ncbi:hypothetical protein FGF82_23740, partial [Salmonella sp. gx-f9]|nr:hypothetical protein [Salmonella sp. gx-f9]